jgi:hypothetical protein
MRTQLICTRLTPPKLAVLAPLVDDEEGLAVDVTGTIVFPVTLLRLDEIDSETEDTELEFPNLNDDEDDEALEAEDEIDEAELDNDDADDAEDLEDVDEAEADPDDTDEADEADEADDLDEADDDPDDPLNINSGEQGVLP